MAAASKIRISEDTVRKAVNALLKYHSRRKIAHQVEEQEEETDDFIYLSLTLKKVPPKNLTVAPHKIPLRHSVLPNDYSQLNICLIIDGKKFTSQTAQNMLKIEVFPFTIQVLKLSKLKSDYKSFSSKKQLYDSFDMFLASENVVPLLPMVLGKVFYKKKRKIPVPLALRADGSNWKEEIEGAWKSSLLCMSGGTCSSVRVGRLGVNEGKEIVENVFGAIDSVLEIVPKKWGGIRCFHLKFSDSLALPIYEGKNASFPGKHGLNEVRDDSSALLVGKKRNRSASLVEEGRKSDQNEKKERMISAI